VHIFHVVAVDHGSWEVIDEHGTDRGRFASRGEATDGRFDSLVDFRREPDGTIVWRKVM
jgi:hypothetical protein